MLDYLLTGGTVVDGTGCPPFRASVGIQHGRLRLFRGSMDGVEARISLAAEGKIISPGFIDLHAHSGLILLDQPKHEAKVAQGVTTEVIGVDGISYAPFLSESELRRFVKLNAGLDGDPDLKYDWLRVEEYLARFDAGTAVNVAYLVGNSPLRLAVVGWDNRPAEASDVDQMAGMLREAMEEGAFGLSTGLDYPPGEYASTTELIGLSKVAATLGGFYHTHVRYTLGDQYLDPIREALEISRASGAPCHITHLYKSAAMAARGGALGVLSLLEEAYDMGMEVSFDTYPYNYSSTRLNYLLPSWVFEDGPEGAAQHLRSSASRESIADTYGRQADIAWDEMWVTNLTLSDHEDVDGLCIAEIARRWGMEPIEVVFELLLSEEQRPSFVSLMDQGYTRAKFVAHPFSMFGSDGILVGKFPSPRTYGTFPRVLSEFVREERYLSLPEAIHKMSGVPARRLGLKNRGAVVDDAHADLVVFDADLVGSPATRQKPRQAPVGFDYVFVNGQIVMDHGRHLGALPGRSLRRGRD